MAVTSLLRTRWAAIGAVVAITLGAGGINIARATIGSGERTSFVAITPCRLADTRPGITENVGTRNTPIGADGTFTLTAHGANGLCTTPIPTGATALSLNVTAVGPTAATYLTIFPTGASLPTTSNLNPTPGQPPVPNAVTVDINASGQFSIFNKFGSVDVIVDIVGYYEDHNHDDRYYQKTETDALLASKGSLLSAVVAADGTLVRGVNAVSASNTFVGNYSVIFNRDVTSCTFVATPGQTGNSGSVTGRIASVSGLSGNTSGVFLRTEDLTPNNTNVSFHLLVFCP